MKILLLLLLVAITVELGSSRSNRDEHWSRRSVDYYEDASWMHEGNNRLLKDRKDKISSYLDYEYANYDYREQKSKDYTASAPHHFTRDDRRPRSANWDNKDRRRRNKMNNIRRSLDYDYRSDRPKSRPRARDVYDESYNDYYSNDYADDKKSHDKRSRNNRENESRPHFHIRHSRPKEKDARKWSMDSWKGNDRSKW
jgi:hypothetical protein